MATIDSLARPNALVKPATAPVIIWATIGALFFFYSIYVWGRWILSDDFQSTATGSDIASSYFILTVRFFEVTCTLAGLALMVWSIRDWRKTGHFSALAMFAFTWLQVCWQDPLGNSFRLWFDYTSYYINFGSWANSFAFWIQPNGNLIPEPIFFVPGGYVLLGAGGSIFAFWLMQTVKEKFPRTGVLGLIMAACLAGIGLDAIIEIFWVRTGLYQYTATIGALTLWAGETYQFPIYESLIIGPCLVAGGVLYYFRDDKGLTLVERGAEKIQQTGLRTTVRFMAVLGFTNVVYLCYNLLIMLSTLYVSPTVQTFPSHIYNGVCGPDTEYHCPTPYQPIPLPNSEP